MDTHHLTSNFTDNDLGPIFVRLKTNLFPWEHTVLVAPLQQSGKRQVRQSLQANRKCQRAESQ